MRQFYSRQSRIARRRYQLLEVLVIMVASSVPAAAALSASRGVLGVLGAVTAALTGLRVLFQWQHNAADFTQTMMAIDGQVSLCEAEAPPYDQKDKLRTLHVAVKDLVESESKGWAQRLLAARAPTANSD
jgi:hypothetical protein